MKVGLGPWGAQARRRESAPTQERSAQQYACEQCGAVLHFEPGQDQLACAYCGHRNKLPETTAEVYESDLPSAMRDVGGARPGPGRIAHQCVGCGAHFEFEDGVHAGPCPFCGHPAVVDTGPERPIKPVAVAPFMVSEADAKRLLKDWLAGLWFAPSGIAESAEKPGSLHGRYMPYWTFDARTQTDYRGQRGDVYYETRRVTRTINGKRVSSVEQVPKIRWRPVSGRVRRDFDDVLAQASDRFDHDLAEALEPWDLQALQPYSADYLSGFEAEGYRNALDDGFQAAKEKMRRRIVADIRHDIGGDQQRISDMRTRHDDTTFKHILLPVWHAEFAFLNKRYFFLVNGRTGEIQGRRPYSAWKIAGAVLLALIAAGGLAAAYVAAQQAGVRF